MLTILIPGMRSSKLDIVIDPCKAFAADLQPFYTVTPCIILVLVLYI